MFRDSTAADMKLKRAMRRHREGEFEAAISLYTDLLESHDKRAEIHYLIGSIKFQVGDLDEAESHMRSAIEANPEYGFAYNNLGSILMALGDMEAAEVAYLDAVRLEDGFADSWYNLGFLYSETGELSRAEGAYLKALEFNPTWPKCHNNLGAVYMMIGMFDKAAASFLRATELDENFAEAYNNLGGLHIFKGDNERAMSALDIALTIQPDMVEALVNKGDALLGLKNYGAAIEVLEQATKQAPDNALAKLRLRRAYTLSTPLWHFTMMNDETRNTAFDNAIRAAIKPGDHVLDIGTGAGLTAMMSARAGAGRVSGCEMIASIANSAKQVIKANGYEDKITVHEKISTSLDAEADFGGKADLVVAEIVSSDLLGEDILPAIEDARRRLMKSGAKVIPAAGSVRCALIGGDGIMSQVETQTCAGFNVQNFNVHSPTRVPLSQIPQKGWALMSDDHTAVRFDFSGEKITNKESKPITIPVTSEGVCCGLVQWLHLELDETFTYENHPMSPMTSGWSAIIHTFDAPIAVKAGQMIHMTVMHDRRIVYFSVDNIS